MINMIGGINMDDNKTDFNEEIIDQEQNLGISNDETVNVQKNYEEKPKKKKSFKGSAISYIAIKHFSLLDMLKNGGLKIL